MSIKNTVYRKKRKNAFKIGTDKDDFNVLLLWLEVRWRQGQENRSFKNGSWGIPVFVLQLEGHENKFLIHFISFICLVKPVLQLSDILPHLCNARLNRYNRAGKTAEVKTIQNFRTGPKRHFSSHFLFFGREGMLLLACAEIHSFTSVMANYFGSGSLFLPGHSDAITTYAAFGLQNASSWRPAW